MKKSILWTIAVVWLFLGLQDAGAQVRGRALYELMAKGGLTKGEGARRVAWLPDGQGYFTSEEDTATKSTQFFRVDPASRKKAPLFGRKTSDALLGSLQKITGQRYQGFPFKRFSFVQGGKAITFDVEKQHFYFDLQQNALRELHRPEVKPQPGTDGLMRNMRGSQLWNGTYSPDYKYFAFVKDYDLFLANTETGEVRQLTFGGNENWLHGRPDWVYPEEFSQLTAYWWSPDSRKLAYYEFDEREVHRYPLVRDLKAEAELELQSYPNPGEPNPTVKLFILDIASGKQVEVKTESHSNNYIVKPTWLLDGRELTFQRLNRHQSELELLAADPATGEARTILTEKEEHFVNLHDDFILLKDNKRFLWSSERSGWRHIYLYDLQGKLISQVTSGDWPVQRIVAVDEDNEWIYFTGYKNLGLETHFYRVKFNGSELKQLTTIAGSHFVSMDPACKYYTDFYSSFSTAPTMNIHRADGKKLRNLYSTNTEKLDELKLESPELVQFKAADGITDLHGLLFKPAGYDPNKSYPLIVSVYGGPHTKMIRNSYQMSGREQTMAQLGFMVWKADNRGLRQRGKKFETETYLKLGQVDLADQTAGVKFITQRPYIDGSRVGVFGHSYGGYMTCLALLKEPEVFHVGVAGAPVTDWRNYDTIYTERYMRTPQENTEGYDLGSALPYAKNLKGKLLLIHGTIDNNVHPGNTIQLIDALVKAGKKFDLMFYPLQRHGIRGPYGRHYRQRLIDYFIENLLDAGESS